MIRHIAALTFAACLANSAFANNPTNDCYCRDSDGQRVELGETRCLTVGGRTFLALCDMSLNTMTWREQSEGCPSS